MRSRVSQWGNSLAIRIPASFSREARIEAGDAVEIQVVNGALLIKPVGATFTLDELLDGITDGNLHAETEWGPAVGDETW